MEPVLKGRLAPLCVFCVLFHLHTCTYTTTHTHKHYYTLPHTTTHTHIIDATLEHLGNGLCSIPLSPTSQAGLSSTVGSTLSPPPCMGNFLSFHKKQRTSLVSKRSHYILISPATFRSDDMVHGIDERMITRVDSKKARRLLSSSSESKEALTPQSISTQPQGQLGPAVWPNGCLDQPPVTDQNGR